MTEKDAKACCVGDARCDCGSYAWSKDNPHVAETCAGNHGIKRAADRRSGQDRRA